MVTEAWSYAFSGIARKAVHRGPRPVFQGCRYLNSASPNRHAGVRNHQSVNRCGRCCAGSLPPLRANIDETVLLVVITEQGEKRNHP
jgi:hypothetical protein